MWEVVGDMWNEKFGKSTEKKTDRDTKKSRSVFSIMSGKLHLPGEPGTRRVDNLSRGRCVLLSSLVFFLGFGLLLSAFSSSFGASGLLTAATCTTGLLTGRFLNLTFTLAIDLIEINQLDQSGFGVITDTRAKLDDPGIATGPAGNLAATVLNNSVTASLS